MSVASCKQWERPLSCGERPAVYRVSSGELTRWDRQVCGARCSRLLLLPSRLHCGRSENTEEQCSQSVLYLTIRVSSCAAQNNVHPDPLESLLKRRPGSCRSGWGLRVCMYHRLPGNASASGLPLLVGQFHKEKGEMKNRIYELDGEPSLVHVVEGGPCDVPKKNRAFILG